MMKYCCPKEDETIATIESNTNAEVEKENISNTKSFDGFLYSISSLVYVFL